MGRYFVEVEKKAKRQLADLFRSGRKSDIKQVELIFKELEANPTTGIGNPEQLKYELSGRWSRRINKKDRLIYKIDNNKIVVTVLSAKGHYD